MSSLFMTSYVHAVHAVHAINASAHASVALQVPARRRGAFNGNSPITVGDQRGRRSGKLA